LSKYGE
jgi:hypothetical protein